MGTGKMTGPAKGKGGKGSESGGGGIPPGGGDGTPPGGGGKRQPGKKAPEFAIHEHIGGQLKAMFDAVVEEPVPDKLRELLEELERKQPKP
jgi:hypothetical protein